eukprot:CAMPEP_0194064824 /NCGR_PEP_ID=MMETSP0009_2-20130614/84053_1 /TAXON_ID=210454 /ORGANISM="Grammatophora oceanica, Strain CCMP 410" /LENGTH=90 /DNA_ID=CAMNT_0038717455 /DNA_START=105 /DNA_END=375 /DNA_ORIENTATION=-
MSFNLLSWVDCLDDLVTLDGDDEACLTTKAAVLSTVASSSHLSSDSGSDVIETTAASQQVGSTKLEDLVTFKRDVNPCSATNSTELFSCE